jgi:hypothetical protein
MKRTIRMIAAILIVGTIAFWAATGANRGWTKTSVPKKIVDEVTGIEGVTYEKHFVPGVDFVGAALLGAGILAGISILFRTKPNDSHNETKHEN